MRSFTILTIVATATLSVFTSAAPVDVGAGLAAAADAKLGVRDLADVDVKNVDILRRDVANLDVENVDILRRDVADVDVEHVDILRRNVADVDVKNVDVLRRDAQLASVPTILNTLTTDISAVIDKLNSITGANATVETISPLLQQVVDIVGTAVSDVKKLVGAPVATVLASVDGTTQVAVSDVATLLAKVLTLIVSALGAVLKVANGDLSVLGNAVSAVGSILSELVSGVSSVVGGLLAELGPLVSSLVPTLTQLGFSALGGVLNIVL